MGCQMVLIRVWAQMFSDRTVTHVTTRPVVSVAEKVVDVRRADQSTESLAAGVEAVAILAYGI